jgi:transcriptional regulator with XRE-family HTH domain
LSTRGLGTVLKKLRQKKGLTQEEVAMRAGVTKPYIAMLESGARKNPSLELVKKLAKALKVTVGELLE